MPLAVIQDDEIMCMGDKRFVSKDVPLVTNRSRSDKILIFDANSGNATFDGYF
jgi:hypothetical protein